MNFNAQSFVHFRWSVLQFATLSLLGGLAVAAALHFAQQETKASKQVQMARQDIRGRLARANDEEAEIRKKIGHYQNLVAKGYIGQERRLEWVEQIAQIKNRRRLIDIQYELAPQKPVDVAVLPAGSVAGDHEFMSSTMRLQMQLLHEDDLLGFLNDLLGSVQAMIHVRECKMERLPVAAGAERASAALLKAECTLEWITLREKKA